MILLNEATKDWERDGVWRIAPDDCAFMKKGDRASIGAKACDAIDLGFADGYRKCLAQVDGVAFTLAAALDHWAVKPERDLTNCLLIAAIAIAGLRGWRFE